MGDSPDLRLCQASDREHGFRELALSELAEEVALVLVGIHPFQNPPLWLTVDDDLLSFTVQKWLLSAVVSGGHHVGSEFFGCFQEGVEFDFAVAEDVRVRGPAF